MESVFENRVVFLLVVIIGILLIMLWSAYVAMSQLENKINLITNKAQTFYKENKSQIPEITKEIRDVIEDGLDAIKDSQKTSSN